MGSDMAPDKATLQALLEAGPCVHCGLGTALHYENPDDDPMKIGPFWDAYPDVAFYYCHTCGHEWATQMMGWGRVFRAFEEQVIIPGDATKPECKHEEAVKWNPYNQVVQCHRCGQVFIPQESKRIPPAAWWELAEQDSNECELCGRDFTSHDPDQHVCQVCIDQFQADNEQANS